MATTQQIETTPMLGHPRSEMFGTRARYEIWERIEGESFQVSDLRGEWVSENIKPVLSALLNAAPERITYMRLDRWTLAVRVEAA